MAINGGLSSLELLFIHMSLRKKRQLNCRRASVLSSSVDKTMLRKTLFFIAAPILIIVGTVFLAAHFISAPAKFVIKNLDSEPVKVVAHWRDKTKNIGQLSPNTITEFFVDDEAAMKFEVTRSNGTAVSAGNVYFTSNTVTRVNITHTSVEVTAE